MGIREQSIFPEIELDKIEKVLGMSITLVTTAPNDEQGKALLDALGVPFRAA
jgi:large subunit ribosomal protein L5